MRRILFITQKIHEADDDLAFATLWVDEFIRQGFDVSVICLEKGTFDDRFPVYSLGKEHGVGKLGRVLRFLKLICTLKYDRVFVHMNPEYFTLGGWWWFITRTPSYLWYTHYTMTPHLFIAGVVSRRLFAATGQSLPQYEGNPKKVVLGHGIDTAFWGGTSGGGDPHALISVHRLSRSKRLELAIGALALLPREYTLTVYGRAIDPAYKAELDALVAEKKLEARVTFKGPVPMFELKNAYPGHRLMLNFASETIDKTMLEGMLFGIYPVTTKRNATAIGLPFAPEMDEPKAIADFILGQSWEKERPEDLRRMVENRHSLESLIRKMGVYIESGT